MRLLASKPPSPRGGRVSRLQRCPSLRFAVVSRANTTLNDELRHFSSLNFITWSHTVYFLKGMASFPQHLVFRACSCNSHTFRAVGDSVTFQECSAVLS